MRAVMVAALGLALIAPAGASANGFVEDVRVLQEWHGTPGGNFGWAVSELQDIDHDGVTDVIVGEPSAGRTWVFSGRTGRTLHRFDGAAGFSIADAGDTARDGVHDVISGTTTRALLYSGRTGDLLHTFTGAGYGYSVSSAGDLNLDGFDDVAIGATSAGVVDIYSGRTYGLLRRLKGDRFGSALDTSPGVLAPELSVGALGLPAQVYAPFASFRRLSLTPPAGASAFGDFFVAGVGRVDRDLFPDFYVGDYGASGGNGWAGVYSGRDGSLIWGWPGGPGDGRGPGREAGDVDRDGRIDLAVGDYTAGATGAGRVNVFSGATGRVLRTITSTTAGENLGFDAVGVGDTNRDGEPDLLLSAASGASVYLVAGNRKRLITPP